MKKLILTLVIVVAVAAGAAAAYFALTVPNDIRAEQLLREARVELRNGNRDAARVKLGSIVKQYPRTDAAAAAVFALFEFNENERREIARLDTQVKALESKRAADASRIERLEKRILASEEAAKQAELARQEAAKKAAAAKKPAPKRTTRRRR
ncbi:MAG: hypothetical protein ACYC7A_12055 [Thermoanaerobaculia bacterium]